MLAALGIAKQDQAMDDFYLMEQCGNMKGNCVSCGSNTPRSNSTTISNIFSGNNTAKQDLESKTQYPIVNALVHVGLQ